MIPTLGHVAVVVGLATTLFASAVFALGGRRRDPVLVTLGRRAMVAAFGLALVGCAAMVFSLLTHDFSVSYVVRNNATTTPPFYSFISLWAALEGSILFWTLLATGWAALVLHRFRHRAQALMPWVGMTLALGTAFFFAVMTWPGDPFLRISPIAGEGTGPNALLQNHPFMGLHPPLLYLGYTGLAIPFAFGVAALITGRTDEEWLGIVRRWTLVPWIFLTAGIVAGAWWSYEVLGWGGYWAWDPVENAALLPWLTATAFIHSSMVAERRGTLRVWSHLLVVLTFWLTLFGTFVTRSGVVASVHSFTASGIGGWFLAALLITLVGGLSLIVWRAPQLRDLRPAGSPVSRESAFLFNNVLFLAISLIVLLGTLYPLAVEAMSGETVSLGAPWFNRVGAPAFVALLFLMGVGPALPWGGASWRTIRERFALPVVAGLVGLALAWLLLGVRGVAPLAAIGLALFVVAMMGEEVVRGARARASGRGEAPPTAAWRLATRNRRRYGGYLVHAGICVMAIAIAVSATMGIEATATLRPGEEMTLGSYRLRHERLVIEPLASDARVRETRAELMISGPQAGALSTALRDYPSSTTPIATPAVRSSFGEDLYVTLIAYDPDTGAATLRVFVNPLVGWIWLGGAIVALGAVFAAWPERRRRPAVVAVAGSVTVRTGLGSRWRWLLIPLLAVPIGWLLLTGLGRDPRSIPSPLIGQPLPSLAGPTLDSGRFDDASLGGRPAVINVWASYCVPCRAEHGLLRDLVEQHGDDLSVIGVIYQTNEDAARDFQERYGSGWTELTDPGGRTALDLGVTGPPATFFVDADGIVRYRHLGPLTTDVLRQQLAALGVEL